MEASGQTQTVAHESDEDTKDDLLDPIVDPEWKDLHPDDERQPISYFGNLSSQLKEPNFLKTRPPDGGKTVHFHPRPEATPIIDSTIDDARILCDPNNNRHPGSAEIAFGNDDGTKAYVNDAGQLICIVQMVDMGPCGLVRARLNYNIDPEKDHPFTNIIQQDRRHGMGLYLLRDFDLNEDDALHQVQYVDDRWPRVLTKYSDIDCEVQWAIEGDAIIQEYTLTCKVSTQVKFGFDGAIVIDDPFMKTDEFLQSSCHYRGGAATYKATEMVSVAGPGGHIQFFATLFVDKSPVEMNLDASQHDPFFTYSDAEYNDVPLDSEGCKRFHHLSQGHTLDMHAGDIRSITAIYHFKSRKWTREEVFDLYTSEEGTMQIDKKKQQEREQEFMVKYQEHKERQSNEPMIEYLAAMWKETYSPEKVTEKIDPNNDRQAGAEVVKDVPRALPFTNWGGEDYDFHRLLGFEWQRTERELIQARRPRFDSIFKAIRADFVGAYGN